MSFFNKSKFYQILYVLHLLLN